LLAGPSRWFERVADNCEGVICADSGPKGRTRGARGERPQIDANNDGQISQSEFVARGASRFERLDTNGDGRVTREEAEAARSHRGGR
jgi:hypothetical protein